MKLPTSKLPDAGREWPNRVGPSAANGPGQRRAERLRTELPDIDRELQRAQKSWGAAQVADDADPFIDSVALNLYGFYSGIERLIDASKTQTYPRRVETYYCQKIIADLRLQAEGSWMAPRGEVPHP
jgi:hypothetical protein